tara:strand:+ start:1267 stop:1857 length:591 start_codon:yes stop_codon:yes gene_type:complete
MYIRVVDNLIKNIPSFWPHDWPFNQIVKQLPDRGNLIEIGPYLGKSTVTWAHEFSKQGKEWNIHTIDAFEGIKNPWPGMEHLQVTEEEHLEKFKNNVSGWHNITYEKLRWTPDYKTNEWYDVLFYDGLHDYEHCKQALDYWVDKVNCLVIDDYDMAHDGTMRAVDEVYNSITWPKEMEHIVVEDKGIAVIWSEQIP